MLDEIQALGLLGLIVCQYLLIRGCFQIKDEIPLAGGSISGKIDRTADLLDEVAQLIADLGDSISPPAVAQPPSGFGDLVASVLNNAMKPVGDHATTQSQWEVLPPDENPPQEQAQDQPR